MCIVASTTSSLVLVYSFFFTSHVNVVRRTYIVWCYWLVLTSLLFFFSFFFSLYSHIFPCVDEHICISICMYIHIYVNIYTHYFFFSFVSFIRCLCCCYCFVQSVSFWNSYSDSWCVRYYRVCSRRFTAICIYTRASLIRNNNCYTSDWHQKKKFI